MFFKDNNELQIPKSDIMTNYTSMKRIQRNMNLFTKIYFFTCVPYAAISLFMIILTVENNALMTFIDGVIFKGAVFAAGFLGCYRHDIRLSWCAVGIQFLDVIFSGLTYFDMFFGIIGVDINGLFLATFIAIAVINVGCFRKYAYLETQPGFPQFSEQFEIQKEKSRQFTENNPFEERMKQLSQHSSSDMNELDTTIRSTDNGSSDSTGVGYMDEI